MSRLPQPGSDVGTWGTVLNNYLLTEHDASGRHDIAALLHLPASSGRVLLSAPLTTQKIQWSTLDKSAVGLANVDNTSDAAKPVSAPQQTALNAKADIAQVIAFGIALS